MSVLCEVCVRLQSRAPYSCFFPKCCFQFEKTKVEISKLQRVFGNVPLELQALFGVILFGQLKSRTEYRIFLSSLGISKNALKKKVRNFSICGNLKKCFEKKGKKFEFSCTRETAWSPCAALQLPRGQFAAQDRNFSIKAQCFFEETESAHISSFF